MFKIDSAGATVDKQFTEGNPQSGVPATVVSADWLNAVQNEIVNILIARGITLDKTKSSQVSDLLQLGIDVWYSNLTYAKNSICQIDSKIYISQLDGNINHNPASDDGTNWKAKITTNEIYVTGNSTIETSTVPAQSILYRNKNAVDNEITSQQFFRAKDISGNIFDGNKIQAKHFEPSYKGQSLEFWNQYNGTWTKAFETWSSAMRIRELNQPAVISKSNPGTGTFPYTMPANFVGLIWLITGWGGNCGSGAGLYWCESDYDSSAINLINYANTNWAYLSLTDGWGGFNLNLVVTDSRVGSVNVFLLPFQAGPALPDNL
jgi:hypothetical protein